MSEAPVLTIPVTASDRPVRGLRRRDAARFIGISPSELDAWVRKGLLPPPAKRCGRVLLWDIRELDAAFDALPDNPSAGRREANPWDDAA